MQLTVRDMFLRDTCLCDICLRDTRLHDTCLRDTPLCEISRLSLRDTLQLSAGYAVDTKRRTTAVPRTLQRPRVLAATAAHQNSPPRHGPGIGACTGRRTLGRKWTRLDGFVESSPPVHSRTLRSLL